MAPRNQKSNDASADEKTGLLGSKDKASNNSKDNNNEREPSPALLYLLVFVTATTAGSLGYDVGIMADAIEPMRTDLSLTAWQEELIVGSLNLFAAPGAIFAGTLADYGGRKVTVQGCAWMFVIGMVLMTVAWDFWSMFIGRVITGLGVGVAFLVAPIYITEVAPDHQRGALNTTFDMAINAGILFGYVSGFVIHALSPGNWRLMMAVGIALPVTVLLLLAKLPESPRYLVMRGIVRGSNNSKSDEEKQSMTPNSMPAYEEAIQALMDLGCSSRKEAENGVKRMQEDVERHDDKESNIRWGPNHINAIGFGIFQQIAGSEAILYYSSSFLQQSGMRSPLLRLFGNCLVGLCKLLPELLSMQLVDTLGRRKLMLASAILRVLSLFSLCLGFYLEWPAELMLAFLCSVVFAFSVGLGPFTLLIASENLKQRERSTGMIYCTVANRLTSAAVALTVVTLIQLLGNGNLFLLYTGLAILSLPFYARTTETAGKSLEDL